jgi:uncharacterized protein (DUF169 family)
MKEKENKDMVKNSIYFEYADELEKMTRLQTFPLAVKLLARESDIPEGAERPFKDFGYRIVLCQGYAMSRRDGRTIAMFKDDMLCFEPVVGYGWVTPPQYFLEGHNRFPEDVKDLEAGKNFVEDFPKLPVGKYTGVVSAPLATANFEPDMVMIYCNSTQLGLLLLGKEYQDGHDLKCNLSSHAACVYSVVPIMEGKDYQVSVPCRGDRYIALAGDDEIIFSVATNKLEDLLAGLRHVKEYGSKLPRNPQMNRSPVVPESYQKIAKMLDMGEN